MPGLQGAGGVVDRGDVIRIEGMTQAQDIGGEQQPSREGAGAIGMADSADPDAGSPDAPASPP